MLRRGAAANPEGECPVRAAKPLVPLIAVAALVACTPLPPHTEAQRLISARDRLAADLQQCSAIHHYDPRHVVGVSEHALAPNEMDWQLCATDAVRVYERANPEMAPLYNSLIDQDTMMTAAIPHGTMTRSQRSARMRDLLAKIKAAEDQQIAASREQQDRQLQQVTDQLRMFQGASGMTGR